MERIRVVKQSVHGFGEDKDSVDLSEDNPLVGSSPESTNNAHGQECLEMDPQEQGQKIKERVERIVELVRSTAQKVS